VSALKNTITKHSNQTVANAHARSFPATIRKTNRCQSGGSTRASCGRGRYDFAKIRHSGKLANIVSHRRDPSIKGPERKGGRPPINLVASVVHSTAATCCCSPCGCLRTSRCRRTVMQYPNISVPPLATWSEPGYASPFVPFSRLELGQFRRPSMFVADAALEKEGLDLWSIQRGQPYTKIALRFWRRLHTLHRERIRSWQAVACAGPTEERFLARLGTG